MKRLFKFKYPKLVLLVILVIISYIVFRNPHVNILVQGLGNLDYIGLFIAGLLFSFGFTTPFAIGFFLISNPSNIYLAALIGGLGALISDFAIFKIIKFSFMDEFNLLQKTEPVRGIEKIMTSHLPSRIKLYFLYVFSGIIIASPLPDELGVTMLAGLSHIRASIFLLISLICNTLGILVLLLI